MDDGGVPQRGKESVIGLYQVRDETTPLMHGTGLITSYTSPNYDSDLKEIIRGSCEYHNSGIKSPYARICSIQATDQDYPPGRMLNTAEQYKTDLFPET